MMNPAEFANISEAEEDFWWYRGMRRILFRILDPWASRGPIERVLEAGCGTGFLSKVLAHRYGWRLFPLDLEWEGLEYGRRMGVPRLLQADIGALPCQTAAFDAVLSMDVIVHFPRGQEDVPIGELARVLRPGGLLVLRVAALDALRSRHSQFALERQRFTRRRLVELVSRHGVRVHRVSYANSLLLPVAAAKFRVWEPLFRKQPESGVRPLPAWLDRLLYLPLAIESVWLGAGRNFPLGQSLILVGEKVD